MNNKKREIIFGKYGGVCAYTGKPLEKDWQMDHVTPQKNYYWQIETKNDKNNLENLLPTIKIINHYKRGLDLEGFRAYMLNFHKRLSKLPKKTIVKRTEKRKEYLFKVAELFGITQDNPFNGKFYFESIEQVK